MALSALSFLLCVAIFMMRRWAPRLSGRAVDLQAVQSMHTRLTPRVGGVAIFGALAVSTRIAPPEISDRYGMFLLAATVLFGVALLEDLGFHIKPRNRLLAAVISSLLVMAMFNMWIPRAGVAALDPVVSHWAIGIPLTLLVTAGTANGFNLIDGVNGLASLAAMAGAVSLALIARAGGHDPLMHLAIMLAAAVFGFFIVNYPLGLIFLGDAGAYTLGFILGWCGVAVLAGIPEASPWAVLLTVFWPVADTILAIYRRTRRKRDTMAPDRLHVHQMVMRTLEICLLRRKRRHVSNPLTTLVLAPFVIAPPLSGAILWNQNTRAFVTVLGFSALFTLSYTLAPMLVRRYRRGT